MTGSATDSDAGSQRKFPTDEGKLIAPLRPAHSLGGAETAYGTSHYSVASFDLESRLSKESERAWHEQMAACLRSDKPIAECRTEMTKMHEEMMGEMGCPERRMHPHGDKQPPPSPQR